MGDFNASDGPNKASRSSVDELLMTAARESANAPNRALKRRVRQRLHKKLGAILTLEEFERAKERFRAMEEEQPGRATWQTPDAKAKPRMGSGYASQPSQLPQPMSIGLSPEWVGLQAAPGTIPVSALPAFLPVREVVLPGQSWCHEEGGLEPNMQILEKTLEILWRGEQDDEHPMIHDQGLLRQLSEQ
mmetsp:Transcript_68308/g.162880  ORF Transcript_68308/g.162880 Transcript_68308/m.162880 type:complete len:189 (+) Transcript_68308:51-617(+)